MKFEDVNIFASEPGMSKRPLGGVLDREEPERIRPCRHLQQVRR
jgi:hypothetical protein